MKTPKIYLEHANITVSKLAEGVHFFQTAFPHFKIRGGGNHEGREWVHLGDDYTYIAINEALDDSSKIIKDYTKKGINHIGFVVGNVKEVAERLLEKGYERDYPKQIEKYRIRDYFADKDGNEYEFVEYLSTKIEERNSYSA